MSKRRRRNDLSRRSTTTFVSLTGPADNIGDALIRRGTLDWARGTSENLVAYTGGAPDVWLRQLGVPSGARLLRSKRSVPRWLAMLVTAPARPVLVFEAGEVPLDRGNVMRELVFLAETVIVRLKGGVVIRPPRGIRAPTHPAAWVHAQAARLSQVALWRDAKSAALMGGASVAPDIGFAAGERDGRDWPEREELIVSLRGQRQPPSQAWIEAVRAIADIEGLRVRTVVQVREDEERSRELAAALNGVFEAWADSDAVAQEEILRQRYDNARLVISDRLHVLVLAALSGAVPVELVPAPTRKITDAFATIGFEGVTCDANCASVESMQSFVRDQFQRRTEIRERVAEAAATLADLEHDLRARIRTARA